MFIHEAVEMAMEQERYMIRTSVDNEFSYRPTKIRPTNSYANCIIYTFNREGQEVHHCKNWSPAAEDLMADDWELVD